MVVVAFLGVKIGVTVDLWAGCTVVVVATSGDYIVVDVVLFEVALLQQAPWQQAPWQLAPWRL